MRRGPLALQADPETPKGSRPFSGHELLGATRPARGQDLKPGPTSSSGPAPQRVTIWVILCDTVWATVCHGVMVGVTACVTVSRSVSVCQASPPPTWQ